MRIIKTILALALVGTPWLIGCTSDNDHHTRTSSRSYDPDYGVSRDYNRYDSRYDRAVESGYGREPWRDDNGRLHHAPGWKADSDRGRLPNDRDDRY